MSAQHTDTLIAVYSQALSLRSLIYNDRSFDPEAAKDQYDNLKAKLVSIDKAAEDYLPEIYAQRYEMERSQSSARIAVSQLVAYIKGRHLSGPSEPAMPVIAGPVVNFLMILPTYGLTVTWAVSASMLSLLEVITNTSLAKLRIAFDPNESFDRRMTKMTQALKPKGIEIPSLLLSALYKVRNKVVHEGKEPTTEELSTIFDLLSSLHEKTKQL